LPTFQMLSISWERYWSWWWYCSGGIQNFGEWIRF
jgi:hypothetical protein